MITVYRNTHASIPEAFIFSLPEVILLPQTTLEITLTPRRSPKPDWVRGMIRRCPMSDNFSLTIEKDLIARLLPEICCSGSHSTCEDNEFCSSNPSKWPTIQNGSDKVRIAFPEEDDTLPGVKGFADVYIGWYTKSGCGSLARDIANITYNKSIPLLTTADGKTFYLPFLPDLHQSGPACSVKGAILEDQVENIKKSLEEKCAIMFDEVNGKLVFNNKRAEDLEKLASLSAKIEKRKGKEDDWWGYVSGGGGIAGVVIFLTWIFMKIVRFFRRGEGTVDDTAYVLKGFNQALHGLTGVLTRIFGTSIPNFAKTMKYVLSFGWARGKEPPVLKPYKDADVPKAETATPAVAETGLSDIKPHADVVSKQFASLVASESFEKEGNRFARLTDTARGYLVNLAMERWGNEPSTKRQLYAEEDQSLTEGKLPMPYIRRFARQHLKKDSMLDILEASAKVWSDARQEPPPAREEPAAPSEFKPELIHVKRQLVHDTNFSRLDSRTQDYIARLAIAHWNELGRENQRGFINLDDRPETGILPINFVRLFRKKEIRLQNRISRRARIYHAILEKLPEIASFRLTIINRRIKVAMRSWDRLPSSIKISFRGLAGKEEERNGSGIPYCFIEYLIKIISISSNARIPSRAASEPWDYTESPEITHHNFDLAYVMHRLATINDKLRYHPTLLRARAKSIVDSWLLLPIEVKREFVIADDTQEMSRKHLLMDIKTVPRSFVAFAHEFSEGVGINGRMGHEIDKDDDDDEPSGTPGMTGGGGGSIGSGNTSPVARREAQIRRAFDPSAAHHFMSMLSTGMTERVGARLGPPYPETSASRLYDASAIPVQHAVGDGLAPVGMLTSPTIVGSAIMMGSPANTPILPMGITKLR